MSKVDWLMIIAKIIELIAQGMSKQNAALKVADNFHVSVNEIWKHGGF